jgi:hypothetical protein
MISAEAKKVTLAVQRCSILFSKCPAEGISGFYSGVAAALDYPGILRNEMWAGLWTMAEIDHPVGYVKFAKIHVPKRFTRATPPRFKYKRNVWPPARLFITFKAVGGASPSSLRKTGTFLQLNQFVQQEF